MDRWLTHALDYIPRWLEFQMRQSEQPGCIVAIAHRDRIVLERAYGLADLATGEEMTPRHRFRVASHSKSFTAAGIMKLREQGALHLDDPVGRHVKGLHPKVARTAIAQILSHSAGITRDGPDAGQFVEDRPFLSLDELMAALSAPPMIEPNTRFKYSNIGFGLLGLIIAAITGEAYRDWIGREVVEAAGLTETEPDMPLPRGARFARGHGARILLGRRLTIPGDYRTSAIGAAAGFVSTARDLARFFAQLAPGSRASILSAEGRREMTRKQWRSPHLPSPFQDATEIEVTGRDRGRIALANGYLNHGEPVRRARGASGRIAEVWFGGNKCRPEARVAAAMERRYGAGPAGRKKRPAAR